MKTKNLSVVTLICFMILLFAACAQNSNDSSQSDNSQDNNADDDDSSDDDDDDNNDDNDNDDNDDHDNDNDDDDIPSYVDRLYAGVAFGYLDIPIGISMGGYGARLGPITPYCQLMGGSSGYYDFPTAKAVSLQMHDKRIVIVKGTLPWPTESLRTQIVNLVKTRTNIDLDRNLILSGSHTHSGPARYFTVPDITGPIGMDTYDQVLTDRIAGSFADVIERALREAVPARIGFGYREGFDPDQKIASDRRCENGPGNFKEDRLWVGQVEDDAGVTMAVLVGMAMHGVIFYRTSLTGDALDGVERGIEAMYDYPVVGIYLQGSAGDASPGGGDLGHPEDQRPQMLGHMVARIVREIQEDISTDDMPEMKIVTRRYTHDRQTLGYQPGEFGWYNYQGNFIEYDIGALECAIFPNESQGSIVDCDNPSTTLIDGYLGCLVDLGWGIFSDVMPYFQQSPLTVAQIGNQYFYTTPGELTAHLAVDIREAIATTLGVDFEQINSLGYAQNYLFYLTQDWDWMQGGFEVEGSLFGWKFGRWLTNEIPNLALLMNEEDPYAEADPDPNFYLKNDVPVDPEVSERLREIETQPQSTANRFDKINFAWHGGHPGIDNFTVTLQKQDAKGFSDVSRQNGTPYTDKGWEMRILLSPTPRYLGHMNEQSRDFLYNLNWETNWDDPAGVLRFKVNGTALTPTGIEPYEIVSESFVLSESDEVTLTNLTAQNIAGTLHIEVDAAYPPNPLGWRLRSPFAGGSNPATVSTGNATAIISIDGYSNTSCSLAFDDQNNKLTGQMVIDHASLEHTIKIEMNSFEDDFGNTNGASVVEISVTP